MWLDANELEIVESGGLGPIIQVDWSSYKYHVNTDLK